MSVLGDVRAGCRTQFLTTGIDADLVAWEGRPFEKPEPLGLYYREALIASTRAVASLGVHARVVTRGLYQITVVGPTGSGTKDVTDAAEAIATVFPPWVQFSGNGLTITVVRSTLGALLVSEKAIELPVRLEWFVSTTNSV